MVSRKNQCGVEKSVTTKKEKNEKNQTNQQQRKII